MPEILTYQVGQTFQSKVLRKEENKKSWQVKGNPVYRHDIYLEDPKTKVQSVKEWVSDYPQIPLTHCIEGVVQWFKITKVTEGKNDQIEPYDPEQSNNRSPLKLASEINNSLPKGTAEEAACHTMNLTGKSITYCTAWAKDLKVAEIAKRPEGSTVTDEDIEDVARWARSLNEKLCEYVNF